MDDRVLRRSTSTSNLPRSRSLLNIYRSQRSASVSSLPTYFSRYRPLWSVPTHYQYRDHYEYWWDRRSLYSPIYSPYYGYRGQRYVGVTPAYTWRQSPFTPPARHWYVDSLDPMSWRRYYQMTPYDRSLIYDRPYSRWYEDRDTGRAVDMYLYGSITLDALQKYWLRSSYPISQQKYSLWDTRYYYPYLRY